MSEPRDRCRSPADLTVSASRAEAADPDPRLAAACVGDARALAELLGEQSERLRLRVRSRIPERLRGLLDAEDVVQEAFTDAFLSIGSFEPAGAESFSAWLWTLARHNVVDAVRMLESQKRGGRRAGDLPPPDLLDSCALLGELLLVASVTSPSEWAMRRERATELQVAIEALPEPHRSVVRRHDLEGHAVETVAQAIGRSPGAVYLLRNRAHRWLRERLLRPGSDGPA